MYVHAIVYVIIQVGIMYVMHALMYVRIQVCIHVHIVEWTAYLTKIAVRAVLILFISMATTFALSVTLRTCSSTDAVS